VINSSPPRRPLVTAAITLFAVLMGLFLPTSSSPASAIDDPDIPVPGQLSYLISDGAWTQYTAPTVLSTKAATYIASVNSVGTVQVTRVSHVYGDIKNTVLQTNLLADDHAAPSLLQLADGRIAAFYSGHQTSPLYYRVSTKPDDTSSFGPRLTLVGSGMETMRPTYTHALYLPGETTYKYYLITRAKDFTYWMTSSADLVRWTKGYQVMGNSFPNTPNHPYARFVSNGIDTIHFAMDEGHVVLTPTNSLYHMYYRKGAFYRSDGTMIRTTTQERQTTETAARPIAVRAGTLVHDGTGPKGKSRVFDVAMSPTGPVIANFSETDTKVRYVNRYSITDGNWASSTPLTTSASVTGVALSHSNPDIVFVTAGDTVYHFETADLGTTWQRAKLSAATSSAQRQRIVTTPWGASTPVDAVWMSGRYTDWNDGGYHTALMAWTRGLRPRTVRATYSANWRLGGRIVANVREGWDGQFVGDVPVSIQYRVNGAWVTGATLHTSTGTAAGAQPKGTATFTVTPTKGADAVRLYVPRLNGWGLAATAAASLK